MVIVDWDLNFNTFAAPIWRGRRPGVAFSDAIIIAKASDNVFVALIVCTHYHCIPFVSNNSLLQAIVCRRSLHKKMNCAWRLQRPEATCRCVMEPEIIGHFYFILNFVFVKGGGCRLGWSFESGKPAAINYKRRYLKLIVLCINVFKSLEKI